MTAAHLQDLDKIYDVQNQFTAFSGMNSSGLNQTIAAAKNRKLYLGPIRKPCCLNIHAGVSEPNIDKWKLVEIV